MNRDKIQSQSTNISSYHKPYTKSLFSTSPPYSPPPPNDAQFFKSTRELFRKYPPLSSLQSAKPRQERMQASSSSKKDKQPLSDPYDHVLFASKQRQFYSDEDSDVHSLQSTQFSDDTDTLQDPTEDLHQTLMASRTDPQPSTRTYESPD